MEYYLLIGCIGALLLGFAISFDHKNPILCMTLRTYFLCKKSSVLHKLFPHKESKMHPHSLLLILPFTVAIAICPFVLATYTLYWAFDIQFVENFMSSNIEFFLGGSLLAVYFIYPVLLILFNEIVKKRESKLDKMNFELLAKKYEYYYENIERMKRTIPK